MTTVDFASVQSMAVAVAVLWYNLPSAALHPSVACKFGKIALDCTTLHYSTLLYCTVLYCINKSLYNINYFYVQFPIKYFEPMVQLKISSVIRMSLVCVICTDYKARSPQIFFFFNTAFKQIRTKITFFVSFFQIFLLPEM